MIMNKALLPLIFAQPRQDLFISTIEGGKTIQTRLAQLGIFPGMKLQIINNYSNGQLMVKAKGARIALGKGLGSMILVESA